MTRYATAHLEEIEEISNGRFPSRPVRFQFGITSFGVNAWTALGGTPGKAYEPEGFDIWAPLAPLYHAGKYAEAADRGRELIGANPEYPGLLYNVACCESLAGRSDDAVEHLRLAIEHSDRFRSLAAGDSDLLTDEKQRGPS
jgi:tetratricopeptide (TPR) repeat protein